MSYEWDAAKLRSNLRKHGVDFAHAVGVLEDPLALTIPDPDQSTEQRFISLGADYLGRVLVVVTTWRGDRIRLISARKASRREREQYGDTHAR